MTYRRWLPRFDPNLRTTVNIRETCLGHSRRVLVSRHGLATTTRSVYDNGGQAACDIVAGREPDVRVVGFTKAMGVIDRREGSPL